MDSFSKCVFVRAGKHTSVHDMHPHIYKNRHSWMPNSLLKSIKTNHVLYKLSITKPTKINRSTYKNYNNKLNSIKRKAERDHYSNQLEINKSDMKKSWKIRKTVIGKKKKNN